MLTVVYSIEWGQINMVGRKIMERTWLYSASGVVTRCH